MLWEPPLKRWIDPVDDNRQNQGPYLLGSPDLINKVISLIKLVSRGVSRVVKIRSNQLWTLLRGGYLPQRFRLPEHSRCLPAKNQETGEVALPLAQTD